jgi:PAS domain S-box-containing protein
MLRRIQELEMQNDELRRAKSVAEVAANQKAEEALLKSNEFNQSLLQTIPFGMDIVDEDGNILFLNDILKQHFGEDALGKKCWDLYRDDKKQCFDCPLHAGIDSGETKPSESHGFLGGKTFEIYHTGMIFNGQKAMLEVFIDITEHKLAEESLRESEERFKALHNASFGGIAIHDKGKILECNQGLSEMMGYSRDELFLMDGFLLIAPDSRELVKNNVAAGFEKPYEAFGMRKNGEIFPMMLEARSVPYKGKMVRTVEFRDITERKHAEEALIRSERELKNAQQITHIGSWYLDVATNRVVWTEELYKMYGFDPSLPPPPYSEHQKLFTPESWELLSASLANTGKTGTPYELELKTVRNDGSNGWMWVRGEAVLDKEGKTVGLWGAAQEITERKLAEYEIRFLNETLENRIAERTKQLEAANNELKFHLSELEQFTYVSNHDLQEPLRTLIQFTRLLNEKYAGKLDEEGDKYIEFISKSATRMSLLVKDLLEYSLLGKESGKSVLDCNKLVDAVLFDLEGSIKKSSARITVQELPTISGCETELRLLFQNLIENAIKYQKHNTVPEIKISAENHEKEWHFFVRDNGIGIDHKHYERIFIIFQRLHNRSEYDGTGIGLAHCKKIVELHGGRIWVESKPGAGSTFAFTIPKR